MVDPVRHRELDAYLTRAEEARAGAEAATLQNVRQRCLRSEAAWREMAARVTLTDKMRATSLAAKQAMAPTLRHESNTIEQKNDQTEIL
jgi:hypothetical protein